MDKSKMIQAMKVQTEDKFPFRSEFSVHVLLKHLKEIYARENIELKIDWKRCEQLGFTKGACAPELYFQELDLVDSIFRAFISPTIKELVPISISLPFRPQNIIWANDLIDRGSLEQYTLSSKPIEFQNSILQTAYAVILGRYYGRKVPPLVTKTLLKTSGQNGYPDYWNFNFLLQFSEIVAHDPPPMTDELADALIRAMNDPEELMRLLPPKHFSFAGFSWMYATRANTEELTSQIQSELVKYGTLIQIDRVQALEKLFQLLYRSNNISVALVFIWGQELLLVTRGGEFKNNCPIMDSIHISTESIQNTEIEQALRTGSVRTLTHIDDPNRHTGDFMFGMRQAGLKVASIVPAIDSDGPVGFVIVGSSDASDLNARNSEILADMMPWFAGAMKQTMSDRKRQVEDVIKAEYTSVHPTLEWRLQQAAREMIVQRQVDPFARANEIEFDHIYPLFGSSDIRSSSKLRNEAIRLDLHQQLNQANKVLSEISSMRDFPIVHLVQQRVRDFEKKIAEAISAGDEIELNQFFKAELHPLFKSLEPISDEFRKVTNSYWQALDSVHQTVYSERHKFEDSVEVINAAMSSYLDAAQKVAQEIYPHFFEKHVTDGIDHDIYIGSSLIENGGAFDPFFLKNLRLWQMQMMCGVSTLTDSIKNLLPIPLETAHLLVVQHNPITVFFDTEEKQLAVKGAYNIRYEIMKKRIDKVQIRNSNERLTQPNKLAVVFSHEAERLEYLSYFTYLKQRGLFKNEPEEFLLEDLQGIDGLRAIRADINLQSKMIDWSLIEKIKSRIESMQASAKSTKAG